MPSYIRTYNLLDGQAVDGSYEAPEATSFEHYLLQISSSGVGGGESCVVKIQGSIAENRPDFSAAATALNPWFYLSFANIATNVEVAGGTGVTINSDTSVGLSLLTEPVRWICATVSSTAGTFNLLIDLHCQNP